MAVSIRPLHSVFAGEVEGVDCRKPLSAEVVAAIDAAGVQEDEPWWSLIRLTFRSPARVAMVQAQDVLGLGSEARMNVPGQIGKAWRWKLNKPLGGDLAKRLREATAETDRLA